MQSRRHNRGRVILGATLAALAALTAGDARRVLAVSELGDLPSWVSEPVERDRHTTLLARFDDAESVQPEYERDGTGAAGRNYDASVAGKHGGGIEIDVAGAQLNFRSHGTLHPQGGTVQFWIRSKPGENIWKDGEEHCLFSAAAEERVLELWKKSDDRLHLRWAGFHWKGDEAVPGDLSVPVQELDGASWHHLLFSWDDEAGRLWLAVNGRVQSLEVGEPLSVGHFHIFFLGSSYYGGVGQTGLDPTAVFQTAAAHFDELKISDVTVEQLQSLHGQKGGLPEEVAVRVQDAICRHLDFISRLQIDGAWSAILYAWPHLLPGITSYRTYFSPDLDRSLKLAHGNNGTPGAGRLFLYGYQVLGDRRYLEVAEKTGEWLLAAQQPEGYWVNSYERRTADRPMPQRGVTTSQRRQVHHEDPTFIAGRQSQAALFMAELYLVTGGQRWLEGFRRAADFTLFAQNPNGSWGHHYNLREKRGENRNQDPHGAEFDNGTQSTQMKVLLVAYQITGEKKYLDGVVKAGDWHVAAQLGPPAQGWALAYDGDNVPVWSRVYHPPAISSSSSWSACKALFFMYGLTGEAKYLAPVRLYVEWEKTALMTVDLDGEKVAMRGQLVDYKTSRPIAVDLKTWEIHHVDTPEDRAAFMQSGATSWVSGTQEQEFPWTRYFKRPDGPRLEAALEQRSQGNRPEPMQLVRAELAESVSSYAGEKLDEVLAGQNEEGVWTRLTTRPGGQGSYNIGRNFVLVEHRAYQLLSLLEQSRILTGEIDREIWTFPSFIHDNEHTLRNQNWMDLSKR